MDMMSNCMLCPRKCGVNRHNAIGFCRSGDTVSAAKAYLHQWEEPCISYKNGAGTVFFSGCSLRCCFCQNMAISRKNIGKSISERRLADIFLELQEQGADNIELVTPTHFVPQILNALDLSKHRLKIPVVYNSGGYELTDTINMLDGYIDIYLPDIKYYSSSASEKYSSAADYFKYASDAVLSMSSQVGRLQYNEDGGLTKGMIIRHLVLPGLRHDSMKIFDWICENIPRENALISIMNQYTPFDFIPDSCAELRRRVTKMEYNSVVNHARALEMDGFTQDITSSAEKYVPDFNFLGI
ncbi:MAG: 4Fe-4S cluster-binding domain-containing protein [Ruminococcus sp.]